jgi:hypothetical protein
MIRTVADRGTGGRPAVVALGAPVEPVERLRGVVRGHARAAVRDLNHHTAADLGEPHRRRRGHRGVLADVAEQIGQHLPDAGLVHGSDQRLRRLRPYRPGWFHRPGIGGRVPHQQRQVRLGDVERGGAVQPGQFEQFRDERAHPPGLLLNAAHGVG